MRVRLGLVLISRVLQEVLISSKFGIGDGLQHVPPEQEGGREKTKVFHCREGHQLIPCCHTGVTLCHSLQWKTFVFFLPSLLLRGDRLQSVTDPIFTPEGTTYIYINVELP